VAGGESAGGHLAAAVGVRLVVERPIHTIETNVEQASALLRFRRRSPDGLAPARIALMHKKVRVPASAHGLQLPHRSGGAAVGPCRSRRS
jgi:hypothetical protein